MKLWLLLARLPLLQTLAPTECYQKPRSEIVVFYRVGDQAISYGKRRIYGAILNTTFGTFSADFCPKGVHDGLPLVEKSISHLRKFSASKSAEQLERFCRLTHFRAAVNCFHTMHPLYFVERNWVFNSTLNEPMGKKSQPLPICESEKFLFQDGPWIDAGLVSTSDRPFRTPSRLKSAVQVH